MERKNYSQLELFSRAEDSDKKRNDARNSFLGYVRSYEKVILLFICFMVTGIISFSLGVEKGKHLTISQGNLQLEATNLKMGSQNMNQTIVLKELAPKIDKNSAPQNYTVQLASYRSKSYAEKEAEQLKKKGFKALVISKGSYSIVCVGNFANKEMARPLLSELKKAYRDSFIRRL